VRLGVELYLSSQHRPSRKEQIDRVLGHSVSSLRAVTMSAFITTVTWLRPSRNDCLPRYFGILYAGLDQDDINHKRAKNAWTNLLAGDTRLLTNNYVLLETSALLQKRLGPAALRLLYRDFVPLLAVDWISQQRHQAGVEALLAARAES